MDPKPTRSFQFHLITALAVMLVFGALTPLLLRSFARSWTEGAAMLYAFALPIAIGAFEIEAFLLRRADPEAKYDRSRHSSGLRIFGITVLEILLIGLWAVCLGMVVTF